MKRENNLMILDYSNYKTLSAQQGIVNFEIAEHNIQLFKHDAICPFCQERIDSKIYYKSKTEYPEWLYGSFNQNETVVQCPKCGWWEYKYINSSDAIIDGIRASNVEYTTAILKEYADNDIDVPLNALREYILKKPDIIYKIDPHKMEDLVRSVFKDFYPSCKVFSFGKTRDGGKDGLLIDENGKQFLIQVKRRENASKAESVTGLRQLIGVKVLEDNVSGCIFVTTADHFSSPAKTYAQQVVQKSVVESFDLYDCKEFLKITDLVKDKLPNSWSSLLKL